MAVKFDKNTHFDIECGNDLGWLIVLKKHSVEYVQTARMFKCHWNEHLGINSNIYESMYSDIQVSWLLYGMIESLNKYEKTYEQKQRWVQICTHLR